MTKGSRTGLWTGSRSRELCRQKLTTNRNGIYLWSGLDPFQASLPLLTDFLEYLFKVRQINVQIIKNYKSVISFYWKSSDYEIPEGDQVLSGLFRRFTRERPMPKKHVVEWDIPLVLAFYQSGRFKDWGQLSDRDLTLKTVFLLALATGKRCNEFHALSYDVCWINAEVQTAELSPLSDFLSKTQVFQPVVLKSYDNTADQGNSEEKLLCPVRTLSYYLQRSNEYRSPELKRLFISYRRDTTKDFNKQSVSNYIKEVVSLAYSEQKSYGSVEPLKAFKPQYVRHVSTSLSALFFYCSMEDIFKAGRGHLQMSSCLTT